jgi:hypothetical protein
LRRIITTLAATAAIGAGVAAIPTTAALAATPYHYYLDNNTINVQFFPSSGVNSFKIYHYSSLADWQLVGNGSVTANRDTGTWNMKVCDDRADGIGPYIDVPGGSYGTGGNGFDTPWQSMP